MSGSSRCVEQCSGCGVAGGGYALGGRALLSSSDGATTADDAGAAAATTAGGREVGDGVSGGEVDAALSPWSYFSMKNKSRMHLRRARRSVVKQKRREQRQAADDTDMDAEGRKRDGEGEDAAADAVVVGSTIAT